MQQLERWSASTARRMYTSAARASGGGDRWERDRPRRRRRGQEEGGGGRRKRRVWTPGLREAQGDVLFGVHSVEAALRYGSRKKCHALLALQNVDEDEDGSGGRGEGGATASRAQATRERIARLADAQSIPVKWLSRQEMNEFLPHSTQKLTVGGGVALDCAPLDGISTVGSAADVTAMLAAVRGANRAKAGGGIKTDDSTLDNDVIIFLDEVSDPRNMGATLRSACYLGAAAVVISPKNSSPLSPVVSRASAGALELLSASGRLAYSHGPLPNLLKSLSEEASFDVVGTVLSGHNVVSLDSAQREGNAAIVFGSEGRGLRTMVRRACSTLVTMPPALGAGSIDSLNVSVASALVMHRFLSQK